MKRKLKTLNSDEIYKQSDFYRRFSRDLLDHKYASEFTLNQNKRYEDDPNQEKYEIVKTAADGEEYLVFVFSLVKVALAMDEAEMFKGVALNLELRSDSINSFSKIDNYWLSLLANLGMIVVFLGIMYALFPILRSTVFGFKKNSSVVKNQAA